MEKHTNLPAPRIPYGYRIRSGKAIIEPGEAQKILSFYHSYINGSSVRTAMQCAGLTFGICKARKILENPIYTGDDFYPAIIDHRLFDQALQVARQRRARHGVKKGVPLARAQQPVPPRRKFVWDKTAGSSVLAADNLKALLDEAARLYSRIGLEQEV